MTVQQYPINQPIIGFATNLIIIHNHYHALIAYGGKCMYVPTYLVIQHANTTC